MAGETRRDVAVAWGEEQFIKREVNRLLEWLYRPDRKVGWVVDTRKLKRFGLWDEAINWGDLSCWSVERLGDLLVVEVQEANSRALEEWISERLREWGWDNVLVRTEW